MIMAGFVDFLRMMMGWWSSGAAAVAGPYTVVAGNCYSTGGVIGTTHSAGPVAGNVFATGAVIGHSGG